MPKKHTYTRAADFAFSGIYNATTADGFKCRIYRAPEDRVWYDAATERMLSTGTRDEAVAASRLRHTRQQLNASLDAANAASLSALNAQHSTK